MTKKMGRPVKEPTATVRLPLATIEAAEEWASKAPEKPTRREAIRRLVEKGLKN